MKLLLNLLVILISVISCNEKDKWAFDFEEITSLQSVEDHTHFLEQIHSKDQEFRGENFNKEITNKVDEVNLQKIEAYLQIHGYPSIEKYGKKASDTPILIIHHSSVITTRERWFPELYKAYKNKELDSGLFSLFLYRYYKFKYDKSFEMESPYKEKDYIEAIIKELTIS